MDNSDSQGLSESPDSADQLPKARRSLFGYWFEPVNDVKIVNVPSDLRSLDIEGLE